MEGLLLPFLKPSMEPHVALFRNVMLSLSSCSHGLHWACKFGGEGAVSGVGILECVDALMRFAKRRFNSECNTTKYKPAVTSLNSRPTQ